MMRPSPAVVSRVIVTVGPLNLVLTFFLFPMLSLGPFGYATTFDLIKTAIQFIPVYTLGAFWEQILLLGAHLFVGVLTLILSLIAWRSTLSRRWYVFGMTLCLLGVVDMVLNRFWGFSPAVISFLASYVILLLGFGGLFRVVSGTSSPTITTPAS